MSLAGLPDRSPRIDLHPSHHLAFNSLGLSMDLDTGTWVCPPCSDPAGLRPGGKGSLGHPCLGSEAPLGRGAVQAGPKEP